jgi:peptidyl-prolyl cis-trans isomerase D
VVYHPEGVKPQSTPTLDEIRTKVEDEFKNERAATLLSQKTQELSDRAKSEHDLKRAAKELGATVKTSDFVGPDGQVPDIGSMGGQASVAFSLKAGEISGAINSGSNGAVLQVLEAQAPADGDYATKRDQIRETLLQQEQQQMFGLYIDNLRERMEKSGKIKINQQEIKALSSTGNGEGM